MVFDLVQSIEKLQKMTKTELSECLNADLRRFVHKPTLKDRILHNEVWYIYNYIRHLRYVEYYQDQYCVKLTFNRL